MNKPVTIRTVTATLPAETMRLVEDLAAARGISVEAFAEMAIAIFAKDMAADDAMEDSLSSDPEFLASLDAAEREMDAGHYYTQEQMEAWFADRIANAERLAAERGGQG